MRRFVKAEIFKLYKNRTFVVLCIVSLVVAVFSLSMLKLVSSESFIKSSLKGMTQEQQQQFMNQLKSASSSNGKIQPGNIGMHIDSKDMFHPTGDEIFHAAFGSGIIEIFLAVLIGAVVAKEYTSGTIKNSIAYGKKREYYYLSKIVSVSIGMIILLAIQVLVVTLGFSIISRLGGSLYTYRTVKDDRSILSSSNGRYGNSITADIAVNLDKKQWRNHWYRDRSILYTAHGCSIFVRKVQLV